MKSDRFTDAQIMGLIRQAEGGVPVPDLYREHGISNATFYRWRAKYGGMDASMISQMKALEEENRRLKRMYADLSMQTDILKEALEKNEAASPAPGTGHTGCGASRGQHCAGLPDFWDIRDLLSLLSATGGGERQDCRSSGGADSGSQEMGIWPVFPVSA